MTIKELKDKLSKYDEHTIVKIKINILDSSCNTIDDSEEEIERISFTDFLEEDENIAVLETTYISEVEE